MTKAYEAFVSIPNEHADGFLFTREYRKLNSLLGVKADSIADLEAAAGVLRSLQSAIALTIKSLEDKQ
jgi:hypothetical protein